MKYLKVSRPDKAGEPFPITKRDLVWFCVLLFVASTLVFAFMSKSNEAADFLSAAGTSASISLAIVAIIYSYIQNFSSQRLEAEMRQTWTKMEERTNHLVNLTAQLQSAVAASHQATKDVERKVEHLSKVDTARDTVKEQRTQDIEERFRELSEQLKALLQGEMQDRALELVEEQQKQVITNLTTSDLKERIIGILASGGTYGDEETPLDWFGGQTAKQIWATLPPDDRQRVSLAALKAVLSEMFRQKLIDEVKWEDNKLHYFVREDFVPANQRPRSKSK